MSSMPTFHFDAATHTYSDSRGEVPGITRLLTLAGKIDDEWYTEESSDRGRKVHKLTAEYDLGVIVDEDLPNLVSAYKGYLLGHVEVMQIVRPNWVHIEQAMYHRRLRFGGTPDRGGTVYQAAAVWEVKSGLPTKAHPLQTALQALLLAEECGLPPELVQRYCCYLKADGHYKVEGHGNKRDFVQVLGIIQEHAA